MTAPSLSSSTISSRPQTANEWARIGLQSARFVLFALLAGTAAAAVAHGIDRYVDYRQRRALKALWRS